MIRRLIWLTIGAVLGITGYRRASRAAKALLPAPGVLAPLARRASGAGQAGPAARGGPSSARTAEFVRDVRAGMAEYLVRHRDI
jgi:hypothetical protein